MLISKLYVNLSFKIIPAVNFYNLIHTLISELEDIYFKLMGRSSSIFYLSFFYFFKFTLLAKYKVYFEKRLF